MKTQPVALLLLPLLAGACHSGARVPESATVIHDGTVIDGTGGVAIPDGVVGVRDGLVVALGPALEPGGKDMGSGTLPRVSGPLPRQELPGLEPTLFLPGVVSTEGVHEFYGSFSPDGRELYFNRGRDLLVTRRVGDSWTVPGPVSFSSGYFDKEAHVTPDGRRLFFISDREPAGIWVAERVGAVWGEPTPVGPGGCLSTSPSGEVYFTDNSGPREAWGIALARMDGPKLSTPLRAEGGWTSPSPDHFPGTHPTLSPDGSYMVFHAFRRGMWGEDADLFLARRNQDGSWGGALALPAYVSSGNAMLATLTPDGKALLFSRDGDIYWVSTEVLPSVPLGPGG